MKTILILILVILAGYFIFADRPVSPSLPVESVVENTNPTSTPAEEPEDIDVTIGLIAIEDNGARGRKIGCNDSVVSATRTVPYTTATLRAALTELLSLNDTTYGESGFYNALAPSDLTLDSVAIENGTATIALQGQLVLQGVCDAPRIQAQLEETARQFKKRSGRKGSSERHFISHHLNWVLMPCDL